MPLSLHSYIVRIVDNTTFVSRYTFDKGVFDFKDKVFRNGGKKDIGLVEII